MTDRISGTTRTCAIVGDPVEHTLSPAMHNAAFRETGLDYIYVAFTVKPGDLAGAVAGMRALGMPGMNVTIPHKVNVIPLLDRLDPLAEKIGAVNTIVNESGILTGYNTDASGFLRAMVENGVRPDGKTVVTLGSGGAARAVSFTLADNGATPVILNRPSGIERAKHLALTVAETTGIKTEALELDRENLEKVLEDADILVNATSVGMSPDTEKSPVPADLLKPGLVVYDIVYSPVKTRLLQDAEAAGAETVSGIDMLVWQGAMAFELWTGKKPPVEVMKNEVMKRL
jgi:shikimate dehydrogenase